jgi:hypothetical protein
MILKFREEYGNIINLIAWQNKITSSLSVKKLYKS